MEINTIVLDGHNVITIDTTVAKNLTLLKIDLNLRQQKLIFWNWLEETQQILATYDSSTSVHFKSCKNLTQLLAGNYNLKFNRNSLQIISNKCMVFIADNEITESSNDNDS